MDVRSRLEHALGAAYSIDRELAGGGMSHVYVAEERAFGRQVALGREDEVRGGLGRRDRDVNPVRSIPLLRMRTSMLVALRRRISTIVKASVSLIAVSLLTLACTSGAPAVDVPRETARLLARDRAWAAAASAGKDVEAVVAFWADDARVVGPNDPTIEGKQAIRKMVAGGFATPGFHVTWTPEVAVVAASGDLGYTRGTNEFTVPNKAGGTTKLPGRYLTVWRRGADGEWRNVEDYTTPTPPDSGAK